MRAYSDRIHHALAFTAKYFGRKAPPGAELGYLVHPWSMAVFLARYGADEATICAGILHYVIEEADGRAREAMEAKVGEKFGPVVLAVARDAAEPKYDDHGRERPWRLCKQDYLLTLASAEPSTLDICVADEIQSCGTTLTALRRLGTEYLRTVSRASVEQNIWWYRSLFEVLEGRPEWPRREMLGELRRMSAELVHGLRIGDDL